MFFNQTKIHQKLSFHSEIQYRSFEINPNVEQLLIRGGLNFHINNTTSASIGYANVSNYSFDKEIQSGIQSSENRMWQQFIMKSSLSRFYFEHRYRLEQRWIESKTQNRYLDRVRYLLRISIPINNKEIKKNTLFFTFYDEVFLHINSTPFDRNRLYGAIGFQLIPNANIQLGYMAQTVGKATKNYFQFGIFYNLDFSKQDLSTSK